MKIIFSACVFLCCLCSHFQHVFFWKSFRSYFFITRTSYKDDILICYTSNVNCTKKETIYVWKVQKKINSKTWLIISFRKQYIWCKVFCNVKIVINSTIAGLFTYNFINLKFRVILLHINSFILVFLRLFC